MNYEVRVAPAAKEDIERIYYYISGELGSPVAAKNLIRKLTDSILSLSEFPTRHRLYYDEPWKSKGVRVFAVGEYLVIYGVKDSIVTVSRVLNGIMDIESILKKDDNQQDKSS